MFNLKLGQIHFYKLFFLILFLFSCACTISARITDLNSSTDLNSNSEPVVSSTNSTISLSKSALSADGVRSVSVTVTLVDQNSKPIPGRDISLSSSRGLSDTITAVRSTTDANGTALFLVTSSVTGSPILTATDSLSLISILNTPVLRVGTWLQQAYVKPSNASTNTLTDYGFFVALSSDGNTMAVGNSAEKSCQTTITNGTGSASDVACANAGAVFIYTRTGSTWSQQAYIKPSNGNLQLGFFGGKIALSTDGNTLVVGAIGDRSCQNTITNGSGSATDTACNSGAVFVYARTGTTWSQTAYIKPSNATSQLGEFGVAVALSKDSSYLAVGAASESSCQNTITNGSSSASDTGCSSAGAVFVYKKIGSNWAQEAYVKASNSHVQGAANFGISVALSSDGSTLAVGNLADSSCQSSITNGSSSAVDTACTSSGAIFVYTRSGSSWSQEAYIKASNTSVGSVLLFGQFVTLSDDGNTLAAGSVADSSCQTTITNGSSSASDTGCSNAGAAFVYKRTGSSWAQEAYIKASNGNIHLASFGVAVSLTESGDTLLAQALQDKSCQVGSTNGSASATDTACTSSSASFVYTRENSVWTQQAYFKPSKLILKGFFNWAFSVISRDGSTIALGARNDRSCQTTITNGSTAATDTACNRSGAVFVFEY